MWQTLSLPLQQPNLATIVCHSWFCNELGVYGMCVSCLLIQTLNTSFKLWASSLKSIAKWECQHVVFKKKKIVKKINTCISSIFPTLRRREIKNAPHHGNKKFWDNWQLQFHLLFAHSLRFAPLKMEQSVNELSGSYTWTCSPKMPASYGASFLPLLTRWGVQSFMTMMTGGTSAQIAKQMRSGEQ